MKYIRKIVVLIIAVVFLASVIIGLGVIFSVKNVNISMQSYTYPEAENMTEADKTNVAAEIDGYRQQILKKYRGTLLGFVNEEELYKNFDGTKYVLQSFEKVYPCTLNLTIKERRESFCVRTGENSYNTYDSYGTLMREGVTLEESLNNIDGAPNVSVSVENVRDIKLIADMAAVFAEEFSSLRSIVRSIEVNTRSNQLIFRFYCGIAVRISEYGTLTKDKIRAAHQKFMTLTGEEKMSGTIVVVANGTGEIVAELFEESD